MTKIIGFTSLSAQDHHKNVPFWTISKRKTL